MAEPHHPPRGSGERIGAGSATRATSGAIIVQIWSEGARIAAKTETSDGSSQGYEAAPQGRNTDHTTGIGSTTFLL